MTSIFLFVLALRNLGAIIRMGGHRVLALSIWPALPRQGDGAPFRAPEVAGMRAGLPARLVQWCRDLSRAVRLAPLGRWVDPADRLGGSSSTRGSCEG